MTPPTKKTETVHKLDVGTILPPKRDIRHGTNVEKIKELAESIKEIGQLQPILVRPVENDQFEVIAGARRVQAIMALRDRPVLAIVRDMDDREVLIASITENDQREDMNPMELAESYRLLHRECGMTQAEVASKMGVSRPKVTNMLRLLDLPGDIQDYMIDGRLGIKHAMLLLQLEEPEQMLICGHKTVEYGWTATQLESHIRTIYNVLKAAREGNPSISIAPILRGPEQMEMCTICDKSKPRDIGRTRWICNDCYQQYVRTIRRSEP